MFITELDTPPTPPAPGATLTIAGDEAQHAVRVKRVEPGDRVELLNGRGMLATGRVTSTGKVRGEWVVEVELECASIAPRVCPWVEVYSAVPKGPRIADLIDQLSQVGAAAWGPLDTARGARDIRPARLERAAAEASKQSGRAWELQIAPALDLPGALHARDAVDRIVLADASGAPMPSHQDDRVRVLVGPEGGWTAAELDQARRTGVVIASVGPHVMRIETAAVIAAAAVLAAYRPRSAAAPAPA